jgi:hypothetical protein
LTVQTSIPGVSFSFDGTKYATNSSGLAKLQTAPGQHLVEAQRFIYSDNVSRLRFVGWEDYTNQISRHISLNGNVTIEISYVRQYLVQVNSTYGQTEGSGWYDANSTASAQVQQPILNLPPVIFSHWSPFGNQTQTRLLFHVTSPQVISGVWDTANEAPLPHQNLRDPKLILSILSLFILAILNVNTPPRKQVLEPRQE